MSGHYRMHRGWQEHPVFRNEPFSRRDAWVWLIEEASYKPRVVTPSGVEVHLGRGQLAHSLRFMARAWKWDEAKVRRFLSRLQKENMIDTRTDAGVTHLTICNYDHYQARENDADAPPDAASTQHRRGGDANENEGRKEVSAVAGGARDPVEIIRAFDAEIVDVFGANLRRPYPNSTDIVVARRWMAEGIDLDLCRGVFRAGMQRRHATGQGPPGMLKYFEGAVADAFAERNRPMPRGNPTNGKRPDHDPASAAAARRRAALERHGLGGMEPGGAGASPWSDEGQVIDGDGRRVA